ncbi:UNVERIFIED_CONTAM: hypothetical protein FKN15_075714 [Acipenser sinensis]
MPVNSEPVTDEGQTDIVRDYTYLSVCLEFRASEGCGRDRQRRRPRLCVCTINSSLLD